MRAASARKTARRGVALVEGAFALVVLLFLLFAMFEYARFLMVLHVTNNAARDAARLASVNVNCPADQVAAKKAEVVAYVATQMGGLQNGLQNYQAAVYPCDPSGFAQSPPAVVPRSLTAGVAADPFNPLDTNNPAWNYQAGFPNRVAVTVKGKYKPNVPTGINLGFFKLTFFPDTIDINITAVMGSEG